MNEKSNSPLSTSEKIARTQEAVDQGWTDPAAEPWTLNNLLKSCIYTASVRGPRLILCVSKDWCLDKILFQYLFLSSDSPQSIFKLKIHWVLAESSPWSWCSRLRLVDWGKSKNTSPFLSKFFFVLILWAIRMVSVALQPGSIHCLSIHSWVLLLSWEPHVYYWVVKEL